MKKISVFDTSVATGNMGDFIIMDAVKKHLYEMFPGAFYFFFPTHDYITEESYKLITKSDYLFVGGTNLLSSNMDTYNQWRIRKDRDASLRNVILMGVGWWQYQEAPNDYTRELLQSVLSPHFLHSVRDSYTADKLAEAGIENVINTGCPTTWQLSQRHCRSIRSRKAKKAIFTITDYKKNRVADRAMYETIRKNYRYVYFWPQGEGDLEYLNSFVADDDLTVLAPSLDGLDNFLSREKVDYIGTRLHGGIRALQHKRRSIIIGVDNRAQEKARDFGFNVVRREDLDTLDAHVNGRQATKLELPMENVRRWKEQF